MTEWTVSKSGDIVVDGQVVGSVVRSVRFDRRVEWEGFDAQGRSVSRQFNKSLTVAHVVGRAK